MRLMARDLQPGDVLISQTSLRLILSVEQLADDFYPDEPHYAAGSAGDIMVSSMTMSFDSLGCLVSTRSKIRVFEPTECYKYNYDLVEARAST